MRRQRKIAPLPHSGRHFLCDSAEVAAGLCPEDPFLSKHTENYIMHSRIMVVQIRVLTLVLLKRARPSECKREGGDQQLTLLTLINNCQDPLTRSTSRSSRSWLWLFFPSRAPSPCSRGNNAAFSPRVSLPLLSARHFQPRSCHLGFLAAEHGQ